MKNKKLLVTIFLLFCLSAFSQSLDEIVAKHIEAIGGFDNWNKLKSMRTESNLKSNGTDITFIGTSVRDKASRSDMLLMGMKGWNIITKEGGWSFYPWGGQTKADAMTADDHKLAIEDLDMMEDFLTYKEKGKTLDYYGMEDVDGTECHKIKMIDKNQKETTFFIDPETFFTIKVTIKSKTNGQVNEYSTFFSNYKKLPEGIVMPMSSNSGWSETIITKIEINIPIDEKLFVPSK